MASELRVRLECISGGEERGQAEKGGDWKGERLLEEKGVAGKMNISGFSFLPPFNLEAKFVFIHLININ